MNDDERGAQDLIQCILNVMEVCMLLMIREGEARVRAVGTIWTMWHWVIMSHMDERAACFASSHRGSVGCDFGWSNGYGWPCAILVHAVGVDNGHRCKACAAEWAAAGGNQCHK